MWTQFILENVHFALNLFAALAFFSVAWLYFDAGFNKRNAQSVFRVLGYLLVSVSYMLGAAHVESTLLPSFSFTISTGISIVTPIVTLVGYVFIIVSLLLDPIEKIPTLHANPLEKMGIIFPISGAFTVHILYPIASILCGALYLRKATIGLERHLKPVALSFFVYGLSQLFSLSQLFRTSMNVSVYQLVAPFGPIWITEHVILFVATIVLIRWVFSYLLKRFETQLFIMITSIIVVIFLLITVTFTGLLVSNMVKVRLSHLETNAKVLQYAVSSKQAEVLSDAQAVASDPQVMTSLEIKMNRLALAEAVQQRLIAKKVGFLILVGSDGQVVARGDDTRRYGDAMSSDPLVKLALAGQAKSSVIVQDGVTSPDVMVYAAAPILKEKKVIGAVVEGVSLDNAFVDGLKKATGLEASLYGGNVLASTTLTTADGVTRPIGLQMEYASIKNTVLSRGIAYNGSLTVMNRPYYVALSPLKDVQSVSVGMVFIGVPQTTVLQLAGRSIELTFIVVIGLLIASIFPVYGISKFITSQVK